ncbi:tetratricopeptide repeat protein [Candidatus Electrothrix sp.]|uniref:tetratricopeptide repeat protein n=1 Tax=Candidatus Electrothrix sp. TaxID=2170559 RepID=UPI004056227E
MSLFDNCEKKEIDEANAILTELEGRVKLDRQRLQTLSQEELSELIDKAQANYIYGLSTSRAGNEEVAQNFYRKAFELLPTHIEALDNYGIGLVERLEFEEAIPYFEQSVVADPSSPLAFVYLVKCYQETENNRMAYMAITHLKCHWPGKSPFVDWSHLGQPKHLPMLVPPFAEGQVWRNKTRSADESSRIWIRLVDLYQESQPVVHISLAHVSPSADGSIIFVSHLPYEPTALSSCVAELTDEKQQWGLEEDRFGEGYGIWLESYNAGEAGVFTAPVDEVVDGLMKGVL